MYFPGFIDILNKYADQAGIERNICYIMLFVVIIVTIYGIAKAITGGMDRRRGGEVLQRHGYQTGRDLEVPRAPPPARPHHTTHRTETRYEEKVVVANRKACKSCGAQNKLDALFCSDCGSML